MECVNHEIFHLLIIITQGHFLIFNLCNDFLTVIRILSAMDKDNKEKDQQSTQQQQTPSGSGKKMDELQDEFLNTGRIGRRNAMPDILDEKRETSTADLPLKLSALTTSGEHHFCVIDNTMPYHFISDSSSSSTCHQAPNQTNNK